MVRTRKPKMKKVSSKGVAISAKISLSDVERFESFTCEETKFFNGLVQNLGPTCRAFPQTVASLTPVHIQLFGELAFHKADISKLTSREELPRQFQKFKEMIFAETVMGRPVLDGPIKTILTAASQPSNIAPLARKKIAETILNHFVKQSKKIAHHNMSSFRETAKFLSPVTNVRSLYLPKSCVRVSWDSMKQESTVSCDYFTNPITVPNSDLTKTANWDAIFMSMTEKLTVNLNLVHSGGSYVIKYNDNYQKKESGFSNQKIGS